MADKRIPRSVRGPGGACGCERWTDGGRAVDTFFLAFFLTDATFSVLDSRAPQDIVPRGTSFGWQNDRRSRCDGSESRFWQAR